MVVLQTSECKLLLLWDEYILKCCGIIRTHWEVVLRSPGHMRSIVYLLLKQVVEKGSRTVAPVRCCTMVGLSPNVSHYSRKTSRDAL